MLVLTRKSGESIIIGEDIEIQVVSVEGDAVRIGIRAPKEVPVFRSEIVEAIRLENLRARRDASQLGQGLDKLLPRVEPKKGGSPGEEKDK